MSEKIVQLNEEVIKGQIKELVRGSVEETLNELLEAEAEKLTQAARYERNEQRQGYRSGHYSRNLTTTSGDVTLKVPKLKGISFETAIIERYRRRESSVEEACALPGFVDSKNEEKTERNAGYLVVSHSGGGMLRQGTRKGIRRTPANRGMRAHRIVKSLDISEDVCHGLCP